MRPTRIRVINMKNQIITSLTICFSLFILCSCGGEITKEERERIKQEIREEMNSQEDSQEEINKAKESLIAEAKMVHKQLAGDHIDHATEVVSVDFDGQNIVYTYMVEESDDISIDILRTQQELIKANCKNILLDNPAFAATKENLIKVGGKIVYNYIGNKSRKIMTITIDVD